MFAHTVVLRYYHVNYFNVSGYKTNKIPLLKDETFLLNNKVNLKL